jgi:uncharacterized protein
MTKYELLKKPFFAAFQKPWRWPDNADPSTWEPLDFDSPTGVRLKGLWGGSLSGPARGAIVFVHPMVVEAKGYFLRFGQAEALRRAGYDVLLFDVNGFGESPTGSFRFPMDIVAAGQALAARSKGLPIGLYGLSLGAGYGICACSFEGHPYSAAFLEAPFATLDEFWRKFSLPAYVVLRAMTLLAPVQLEELRPVSRITKLRGLKKLVLVYGGKDELTPPSMGERLLAACAPSTQSSLWVVPEAKHCQAQRIAADEYKRRMREFFDAALAADAD